MIYRIMRVQCDAQDCEVKIEMSGSLGFDEVVTLLEAHRWAVTPVPIGVSSYYTLCPEHRESEGVGDDADR